MARGDSYYTISNITAGVPYIVRVTGLTEDAELYVYDSAGIKVALCASTGVTTSEICEVTTTGNSMLIRIDGARVTNGTGFSLDVFQKQG